MLLTDEISQFHILKDDFDARGLKTEKELCFVSYDQMVDYVPRALPLQLECLTSIKQR